MGVSVRTRGLKPTAKAIGGAVPARVVRFMQGRNAQPLPHGVDPDPILTAHEEWLAWITFRDEDDAQSAITI
jgi:hypothetical protein